MKLRWFGHACFELILENGTRIIADPFDPSVGYAQPTGAVDIVTLSHQHHDHNDISPFANVGTVLCEEGTRSFDGVTISTVMTCHDDVGGTKRGKNIVFVFEAEGLRIAHCGDLGHMLSSEQIAALGRIDVLLVPVGGFYTIDADTAEAVRKEIAPRLTIPMHYLTPVMRFPITNETPFLAQNGGVHADTVGIELTNDSIGTFPTVLALKYA